MTDDVFCSTLTGISVFGFALDREFLRTFHTALVRLFGIFSYGQLDV